MIKDPFILRDIEITEFDYHGNKRQVHIRYAWYPNDVDVRVKYKISEVDDMIVAAIKRQYPTACTNKTTIQHEDQIFALRNTARPQYEYIQLVPELDTSADNCIEFDGKSVHSISLPIYAIFPLTDSNGLLTIALKSLTYPLAFDHQEWAEITDKFEVFSHNVLPVTKLMSYALPGILYPLNDNEIEVGDYFFISINKVARVVKKEGSIITMSDGNFYYHSELRPLRYYYLDHDGFTPEQTQVFCHYTASHPEAEYAHQVQNYFRSLTVGEVILSSVDMVKDSLIYIKII